MKAMRKSEGASEYITQATGALEQITAVDKMIALHQRKNDPNDLMLIQYQDQRREFIKELATLPSKLDISPDDLAS